MRQTFLLLLALTLATGAAQAQEKFQRKSGLWEVKRTSTRTEEKARVYQMCIDQASDNALRQLAEGMRNERCETSKVAREGDKLTVDAVCKLGRTRTTARTHAVITGKFDSAYKIESKSTFDPPIRGTAEGTTVMEAKWTGACKPDQRAGDVILPNGVKLNVKSDDQAAADAETPHGTSSAPVTHDGKSAAPKHERGYTPAPTK
jgi:hypothetical protein